MNSGTPFPSQFKVVEFSQPPDENRFDFLNRIELVAHNYAVSGCTVLNLSFATPHIAFLFLKEPSES